MRERSSSETGPLAGSLLLAHPSLQDENFRRSVILLSAHDANGAMGVVLNRPLGKRLGQLTTDFALGPLASVPLYKGGPVQPEQLLLCGWRPHDDGSGFQLMFGIDPVKAAELQAEKGVHLRGFLGYAGWTGGQLENELRQNTWIVAPIVAQMLEGEQDESLWKRMLGSISHEWKLLAEEPEDPSQN
ncbi:YqgE/AlgH family protein [Opitutaceae bacterium EW11]|nr:YqgE/AlgH family protein [Opitutaceae bacterium EW11]